MELSSICYSFFLSVISIVFSATGIYALRIATIPVSDMVKDQFENFIFLALSYSISYAFLLRPAFDLELKDRYLNSKTFFPYLSIYLSLYLSPSATSSENNKLTSDEEIIPVLVRFCILVSTIFWVLEKVMRSTDGFGVLEKALKSMGYELYPKSETVASYMNKFVDHSRKFPYHTLSWVLLHGFLLLFIHLNNEPSFGDLRGYVILVCSYFLMHFFFKIVDLVEEQISISTMAAYAYEQRRIIEIVCGTLATILAQYYFRIQSVALMFAFLCLATAWLGILANVHPCTDFGIFQFLVAASLQLAVNLFGLHFYTFVVALGAIILMVLRWKMESLDEIILKLYTFIVALGGIILKLLSRRKMESVSVRHLPVSQARGGRWSQ